MGWGLSASGVRTMRACRQDSLPRVLSSIESFATRPRAHRGLTLPDVDSDNTLVTHHGTRTDEGLETRLLRGALERSMFDDGPAVKLGRFTVLEKIGAGGMGVVYAAHDPDLDRKVAVKVLRSLRTGALETERLFREAQAMARLSHPHVVTVHEVGVEDDHVFVAMEYVEGGTLADLIHSGQPCEKARISPTLSLMRQCAQGLAAAHATGTVHRDFKPTNVLLTVDGRAKIADFGLARFDDSEPDPAASDSLSSADALAQRPASGSSTASGSPSNRLTLTGDVLGTPAYMAPEQLDGVADVQTDQFSFCAAFYEVFYGHRPFKGDNLTELLVNIAEGRMETAPPSSHVPGWLHRVLRRGLSLRPEDRYLDMSALSDALEVGERRRRRKGYATRAIGGIAVAGTLVGAYVGTTRYQTQLRVDACVARGDEIDKLWNDGSRQALRQGLVASEIHEAESTADKVMPWVDAQAQAWRDARTTVCLSDGVHETWSASKLDKALWCLQDRQLELSSLVEGFSHPDESTAGRVIEVVTDLSPIEACMDDAFLAGMASPPPVEDRPALTSLRASLSSVRFLARTGEYARGLTLAESARVEAERLDWPPLVAAAHAEQASLLSFNGSAKEAEKLTIQAYMEAVRCGSWDLAHTTANRLAFNVGVRQTRLAEGELWSEHALTVLVHAGDPFGLRRAAVLATQGQIHQQMQDLDKALELFEQALAIRKAALHPQHPTIATSLNDIATVLDGLGLLDRSMEMHTRALTIREAAFGPAHPLVASVLNNLAVGHARQAQFGPAAELFGRALRIDEANLGPDHPRLVLALSNLGSVHHAQQEYDKAKRLHARALRILENNPAPNKRQQATVMHNLAQAHSALKEFSQARQLLEGALVIQLDALGADHPDIAATRNTLGFVLLELLEPDMALEQFEQALPIAPPPSVADSERGIATSLWRGEADRQRALQWATRARKSYVALGAPALDNILAVDALLLELSPP